MRNIKLTECETGGINLFVSEIITLPMVEAIYLLPYQSKVFGEFGVDIVTVYNNSLRYDHLLTGGDEKRETSYEFKRLQDDVSRYGAIFNGSRLRFFSQDYSDFLPFILTSRERIAKHELARGIILFDRFGNLQDKQVEAQREFGLPGTVRITNIDNIKEVEKPSLEYLKTTN